MCGDIVAEMGKSWAKKEQKWANVEWAEWEEGVPKVRDWFCHPGVRGPLWDSKGQDFLQIQERAGGSSGSQDGEHRQEKKERREGKKIICQRVRNEQLQTKQRMRLPPLLPPTLHRE